ncbi:DsbE family thiol:disulfide interchange protein [Dongia soli]|uniref:DsbE family thiol:disulfide interchange protein n=1 Tax=Dongia soli TaxID=600628 RepID=A0ABU5EHH7_9PROT|nr:DsbE family thiol:disulfide interchange protein [Dongia soli]MDY0885899.1 DsbE family thiol:disulfide interchange protein [Dongia soli]
MSMRRLLFTLPLFALAALAVVFALGLSPNRDPHAIDSPLVGKPVAGFVAPALVNGESGVAAGDLRTDAYRGQVVAINFFASWCLPCRAEHPLLKKLAIKAGLPVLGLAWKDKKKASQDFLDELGNPYFQVGSDENGRIGITSFGITGVPETFILDKEGIIRARIPGPLSDDLIETQLLPLIKDLQK